MLNRKIKQSFIRNRRPEMAPLKKSQTNTYYTVDSCTLTFQIYMHNDKSTHSLFGTASQRHQRSFNGAK